MNLGAEMTVEESINLQVLHWATPQGKVRLVVTIPGVGYYELRFLECFCCVEKRLMGYWRKWKMFQVLFSKYENSS